MYLLTVCFFPDGHLLRVNGIARIIDVIRPAYFGYVVIRFALITLHNKYN
jgi:hypothetical protein